MQLLFEESEEKGPHKGLGYLHGKVVRFQQRGIKVPQIGWNQLEVIKKSSLMQGIQNGGYVYFNHGYYCVPYDSSDVLTMTDYGVRFASSVQRNNIFGVQFHPEKSQQIGLRLIKNFVEL
jgi:glutamine amidotransferase